ncbi:MAG: DinB family protein [Planctomycetaceae bacterium]|nr:DinB family protein [Planctomycetaceae bacterium]
MFDNEIAINQFQLSLLSRIVDDLADDSLYEPSPGHGHTPLWILGHLAICAEFGQSLLGGQLTHHDWAATFGPGSSDRPAPNPAWSKVLFRDAITACYSSLQSMAAHANSEHLAKPHAFEFFRGTPIATIGHAVALLLTNHFGFHISQLLSCRRVQGHKPLF